jgi:hypothetical protein
MACLKLRNGHALFLGLRACAFALQAEPFRALFWALNFTLLRSRFRAPSFSRSCFRAPRFSRSYFRAPNVLSWYWLPFALPVSFRPRVPIYIYTLTPTYIHTSLLKYIHPYKDIVLYIHPHIFTSPHTYVYPLLHTYIHTYILTSPPQDKKARIRSFFLSRSSLSLFSALFFFALPRFLFSFALASAKARIKRGCPALSKLLFPLLTSLYIQQLRSWTVPSAQLIIHTTVPLDCSL